MEEFQVYHQNSTLYHPQANGMVEEFNNILDNALMMVFNEQRNDWDMRVPTVLWDYRTTCKKLTEKMPFRSIYSIEAVIPMEYIVPSLGIVAFIEMADHSALEE